MVDENADNAKCLPGAVNVRFLYGRWKRKRLQTRGEISTGSDSSMVDENHPAPNRCTLLTCSDSSMVDENLTTVWWSVTGECSDSSMVDENAFMWAATMGKKAVQIPLWSMKTAKSGTAKKWLKGFRFLYGRWKLLLPGLYLYLHPSSDSSMVDEN